MLGKHGWIMVAVTRKIWIKLVLCGRYKENDDAVNLVRYTPPVGGIMWCPLIFRCIFSCLCCHSLKGRTTLRSAKSWWSPERLKTPHRGKVCHVPLNSVMAGLTHDWVIPLFTLQGSQRPFYRHFSFSNTSKCSSRCELKTLAMTQESRQDRAPLFWSSKTAGTFVGAGHSGDHDANRGSRDPRCSVSLRCSLVGKHPKTTGKQIQNWEKTWGNIFWNIWRASYILEDQGCDVKQVFVNLTLEHDFIYFICVSFGWVETTSQISSWWRPRQIALKGPFFSIHLPNMTTPNDRGYCNYPKISCLKNHMFTLRVAILGYFVAFWYFAFPDKPMPISYCWFLVPSSEPTPLISPWWWSPREWLCSIASLHRCSIGTWRQTSLLAGQGTTVFCYFIVLNSVNMC